MADVTKEVLATDGLYELREGDTVDFVALSLAIRDWRIKNYNESLGILLVSGGILLEVFMTFDESGEVTVRTERNIPKECEAELVSWMSFQDVYELGDHKPVKVTVPALLSTSFALFETKYGSTFLTGIAIEYDTEDSPKMPV